MAHAWRLHGTCMAHAWRMHGVCMAHAWRLHGACMALACTTYQHQARLRALEESRGAMEERLAAVEAAAEAMHRELHGRRRSVRGSNSCTTTTTITSSSSTSTSTTSRSHSSIHPEVLHTPLGSSAGLRVSGSNRLATRPSLGPHTRHDPRSGPSPRPGPCPRPDSFLVSLALALARACPCLLSPAPTAAPAPAPSPPPRAHPHTPHPPKVDAQLQALNEAAAAVAAGPASPRGFGLTTGLSVSGSAASGGGAVRGARPRSAGAPQRRYGNGTIGGVVHATPSAGTAGYQHLRLTSGVGEQAADGPVARAGAGTTACADARASPRSPSRMPGSGASGGGGRSSGSGGGDLGGGGGDLGGGEAGFIGALVNAGPCPPSPFLEPESRAPNPWTPRLNP